MRTRSLAIVAAIAALATPAALAIAPAHAGYTDYGAFSTKCAYSHANNDDPILYPGGEGAAHRHHFFGNTTTSYKSTTASLEKGAANCDRVEDASAYWFPALYVDGVEVPFEAAHVYYRNTNVKDDSQIVPFPKGFRMIAGTAAHPEAPAKERTAVWNCTGQPTSKGTPDVPATCGNKKLIATVTFPSCWDGKNLTSTDQSHVVYPWQNTSVPTKCPSTHPVVLPELTEWVRYDPPTKDYSGITIASGDPDTLHADFWNAWEEGELADLVNDCLVGGQECGTVGK